MDKLDERCLEQQLLGISQDVLKGFIDYPEIAVKTRYTKHIKRKVEQFPDHLSLIAYCIASVQSPVALIHHLAPRFSGHHGPPSQVINVFYTVDGNSQTGNHAQSVNILNGRTMPVKPISCRISGY